MKKRLLPNWEKRMLRLYVLLSCIFNLYAEYIMKSAWLDESQIEINISRRNSNKFRYTDDNTLMAETEEELKSLEKGERVKKLA